MTFINEYVFIHDKSQIRSIEVMDDNIKSFEHVARKYHVDFTVKRDKTTEPPRYLVFFKGKDADVITQA